VIFITTVIVYILSKTKSHAIAYNLQGIKKRNNLTLKTMDNTEQKPLSLQDVLNELAAFYHERVPSKGAGFPRRLITLYASQQTEQLQLDNAHLRLEIDQHDTEKEALQDEVERLRNEIMLKDSHSLEQYNNDREEKEALQADLDLWKNDALSLRELRDDLKAEVERMKREASKFAFESDRAKDDRNKAERRNTQLEEALRECKTEALFGRSENRLRTIADIVDKALHP
jgi:hypothetical protein